MAGDYKSSMPIFTREDVGAVERVLIAGWYTTGSSVVPMSVDTNGYVNVNIMSGAGGYQYQDNVSQTGIYGNAILGGDGSNLQLIKVDSSGRLQIDIAAQTLATVKISKDANANSDTNPIFVKVVDVVLGNEIHDYDTSTDVGVGSPDSHDYPIPSGTTFKLRKVLASASGAMKIEVQVGPLASLATKAVVFTSSANPIADIEFTQPIEITNSVGTEIVRVIRTNRERQTMNVYSTIMGIA